MSLPFRPHTENYPPGRVVHHQEAIRVDEAEPDALNVDCHDDWLLWQIVDAQDRICGVYRTRSEADRIADGRRVLLASYAPEAGRAALQGEPVELSWHVPNDTEFRIEEFEDVCIVVHESDPDRSRKRAAAFIDLLQRRGAHVLPRPNGRAGIFLNASAGISRVSKCCPECGRTKSRPCGMLTLPIEPQSGFRPVSWRAVPDPVVSKLPLTSAARACRELNAPLMAASRRHVWHALARTTKGGKWSVVAVRVPSDWQPTTLGCLPPNLERVLQPAHEQRGRNLSAMSARPIQSWSVILHAADLEFDKVPQAKDGAA